MSVWKGLLRTFCNLQSEIKINWLEELLNDPPWFEYSEFFKFLSGVIKWDPSTSILDLVITKILNEWSNQENKQTEMESLLLFKCTVSFLGRINKLTRKDKFASHLSRIWRKVFNYPAQEFIKLKLIREYRRELPFIWLFNYVLTDEEFFYRQDLNFMGFDSGEEVGIVLIVFEILIELLEKGRVEDSGEVINDLRVSGLLEKIGALWRNLLLTDFNLNDQKISMVSKLIKLLALASSIASSNSLFDSLPDLFASLLPILNVKSIEIGNENGIHLWTLRLIDSILRKTPGKVYVLSQERAEVVEIAHLVIQITSKSLELNEKELDGSEKFKKATDGLINCVLERWEALACPVEIESEFIETISKYLDFIYKKMKVATTTSTTVESLSHFRFLYIFAKHLRGLKAFGSLLIKLFRNALKGTAAFLNENNKNDKTKNGYRRDHFDTLNSLTKLVVEDGGTDKSFLELFQQFPSLISDVYDIIEALKESGTERISESENSGDEINSESKKMEMEWLLVLAESPRTRPVLMNFLVDPRQINELSDRNWIEFFGKLFWMTNNSCVNSIDEWTGKKFLNNFLKRSRGALISSNCNDFNFHDFSFLTSNYCKNLLKICLKENVLIGMGIDIDDLIFVLGWTMFDSELFGSVLSSLKVLRNENEPILILKTFNLIEHLTDPLFLHLIMFKTKKCSTLIAVDCFQKLCHYLGDELRKPEELIEILFKTDENKFDTATKTETDNQKFYSSSLRCSSLHLINSNSNLRLQAAAEWKLLVNSGKFVSILEEENKQMIKTEEKTQNKNYMKNDKDFGIYLENLFTEITDGSFCPFIKESDDPIEMLLECYKYGQFRSARLLHPVILSRYRLSELLLRIPFELLLRNEDDFGKSILNNLLVEGWTDEDVIVVHELLMDRNVTCKIIKNNLESLKIYYKQKCKY